MISKIKKILNEEGIEHVGVISIDDCEIINTRLMPDNANSAIMFTIPYRSTKNISNDGFSEYSRVYDYHNFCKKLYERTIAKMKEKTGFDFWGFCDHSPINEKLAIAKCGLGIIGRNSLFIDNEYGSFVFIGSLLTNMKTDFTAKDITTCENCGKCIESCPNSAIIEKGIDRSRCLSGISQKKRKTEEEKALLKSKNVVWGCDICQIVCPHNIKAKLSSINYFRESRIQTIDKNFILQLSDDEFDKFAFAYKGKDLILNNIEFK
jgi:epoxyqueuosine reductase QueG